jgi:hypothetical protein
MADDGGQRRGLEGVGEDLGGLAGRMAGRMSDAAVNATGAIFDSMASMLGAWWSGDEARRAARSFDEGEERACREHFESARQRRGGGGDYESTRPLYQFGFVARQNPSYRGRSFNEVEPELRSAWESASSGRSRDWNEVRDYVGFSYRNRPGL